MKLFFKKLYASQLTALIFLISGLIIYTVKSIRYAVFLPSVLDEGLFLLKGIYFTNGSYVPYQDYGFWMNKMPFGYLFSGWLQAVFGPGLLTGRAAAVFFGVTALIGLWLINKRLTGNLWLSALLVWVYALNNSLIQIYSQFFSEVLVAFMLVWMLYLILGTQRKPWQYLIGGILLGLIVITRQNLVPLLLIIPGYIYWETRSRQKTLVNFIPALVLFLLVHVLYWPNIMQMWMPWLPQSLTPFLDNFRVQLPGEAVYNPLIPSVTRLHAFWEGLRIHFIPITASLIFFLLLIEKSRDQQNQNPLFPTKAVLFLPLVYLFLVFEHFSATILLDYCVYCFSMYLSFFSAFGALALVCSLPLLFRKNTKSNPFSLVLSVLLTLTWSTGFFYGTWRKLEKWITHIQVPRSRNLTDTVDLWVIFHNKFGWSEELNKIILPTLAGLLLGILVLFAAVVVFLVLRKRVQRPSFSKITLGLVLCLGIIFLPSTILGGEFAPKLCSNIVRTYQQVGKEVHPLITENAKVYYAGSDSPLLMLYLPKVQLFPQQYEGIYSYYRGGDSATLEKYGYWNEQSAVNWVKQTDYLIVEEKYLSEFFSSLADSADFQTIYHSPVMDACDPDSEIFIFQRKEK